MPEQPVADFSLVKKRVWVTGHRGMVGSSLLRRLVNEGCTLLTADRAELDLRRQVDVEDWLATNRPDVVIMAAATVGGILANATRPVDFLYDNLAITSNVINGAAKINVQKLMFLGAGCQYPRLAKQPTTEDSLLEGLPEPTNEWYSVAKIAGVKLCQAFRLQSGCDFISVVPSNLYGPGDHFDLQSSHVIPSLILKAVEAKAQGTAELSVWGTGKPVREFMHVDDCADALVFLLKKYSSVQPINVGTGEEISIGELSRAVCDVVDFTGRLAFDASKPDGAPRKLLDSSRIRHMGWRPRIGLKDGLSQTYQWFLSQRGAASTGMRI